MADFLAAQIPWIHFVQSFRNPFLDLFFKAVTFTGEEYFFLLLIPVIWFFSDWRKAVKLSFVLFCSVYLNSVFKDLLAQPRPFVLDPSVRLIDIGGYGLPSGHAQSSFVVWTCLLMAYPARHVLRWISPGMILLVALSRVYLGAHFPTDIVGGWLVGGIWFFIFWFVLLPSVQNLRWPLKGGWAAVGVASSIFLALLHSSSTALSVMGVTGGLMLVLFLRGKYLVDVERTLQKKMLVFGIALSSLLLLYLGLKWMAPEGDGLAVMAFQYFRYFILVLWLGFGFEKTISLKRSLITAT